MAQNEITDIPQFLYLYLTISLNLASPDPLVLVIDGIFALIFGA
jgi:hypothetical protein